MRKNRPCLNGLSDIFAFFRSNDTPIWFVSPTPFNLLGIDRWVRCFEYLNYFDCFAGQHPRIFVPGSAGPRDFQSIEEVCNHLLEHKEVADRISTRQAGGRGGKLVLVMFDEHTERIAAEMGLEIALPPRALRERLDSKIVTTHIGNRAGVASAPNVLTRATSYADVMRVARAAGLGDDLVIQTPYGDSGRTTFFVRSEDDWNRCADKVADDDLKVMKRINHLPGTVEAVATRHGTLVGPLQVDLTGHCELTPYKGGWCGNDVFPGSFSEAQRERVRTMTRALGGELLREGYRGVFCVDFLIDIDSDEVYLGELNPRVSGASSLTNLIASTYGGVPLFLFHLLEFMDVDYEIDIDEVQARWRHFDLWSQLVLKQTDDKVELITKAPPSGLWRMDCSGAIEFVRHDVDWSSVADENEAFYLRVYGSGEYRYHGADMGVIVARGRMQSDDRRLLDRARAWAQGILARFEGAPPPDATAAPQWSPSKMF
jgi:biotin carboxylase